MPEDLWAVPNADKLLGRGTLRPALTWFSFGGNSGSYGFVSATIDENCVVPLFPLFRSERSVFARRRSDNRLPLLGASGKFHG